MTKRYLGDGVYIEVERGMFKLTAEDGTRATNTIYLEPEVYHEFHRYATEAFAFYAADRETRLAPKEEDSKKFHCAEYDGCTKDHCCYPGEESCAMRSGSVNENKEIPR